MLVLVVLLGLLVAHCASNSTTDRTPGTISNTAAEVAKLTLCFASLALRVLVPTLLLQTLSTDEVTDRLLRRAHGLVPLAALTLRVVLRHAPAGDAEAAYGATGMRESVLGFGFALLVGRLLLVGCVAGDGAQSGLSGAGGL